MYLLKTKCFLIKPNVPMKMTVNAQPGLLLLHVRIAFWRGFWDQSKLQLSIKRHPFGSRRLLSEAFIITHIPYLGCLCLLV